MTHIFKTLLAASTLTLVMAASPAYAQLSDMKDKAKEMAVDKAEDTAKDEMARQVTGDMAVAGDAVIEVGADMVKGKSATDAMMGQVKSEGKAMAKGEEGADAMTKSMSTEDAMTAGKVMIKGGSKEDAAMAIAKKKAKKKMKIMAEEKVDGMMKTDGHGKDGIAASGDMKMETKTHMSTSGMSTSTHSSTSISTTTVVNCPAGTTAQPNGTCMITGDYNPR